MKEAINSVVIFFTSFYVFSWCTDYGATSDDDEELGFIIITSCSPLLDENCHNHHDAWQANW